MLDMLRFLRRAALALALAILPGCGGGFDVTLWWFDDSCALAPSIVSEPPTTAIVGQPYVYPLVFSASSTCAVGSCFDVLPLRMPPGASYEAATQTVRWTPSAGQLGMVAVFELATITRDCGRQVTWSWAVQVRA